MKDKKQYWKTKEKQTDKERRKKIQWRKLATNISGGNRRRRLEKKNIEDLKKKRKREREEEAQN